MLAGGSGEASGGVVAEWVHLDERSPHLHAVVVPLHEGRLNARHFFGGAKKLEALQDEFASLMQPLGLVRGVRGSDALIYLFLPGGLLWIGLLSRSNVPTICGSPWGCLRLLLTRLRRRRQRLRR